ncbi:MAG: FAD:protein FMN transferase [Ruminococcus albus]|nr:FAD:protein FMN transferase [Ruminococcus albus]
MPEISRVLPMLMCLTLLTSCASDKAVSSTAADPNAKSSGSIFAMDTYITVTAYGENGDAGISAAKDEISRLEKMWSVTDENSEIYAVDHAGSAEMSISDETAELIEFALDMHERTGGALDISLYPVLCAWGFTTGEYRVPDDDEIEGLLARTGVEKIKLSGNNITLPDGMEIDLGAVAKGCAGDKAAAALKESGVECALLDLGGNIQTVGETKPDGKKWKIGIRDPYGEGSVATLEIGESAVITSGGYERYFEEDGVVYKHILDPKTGRPAESGLVSATAIGKEGRYCDSLSTSLYVLGAEGAEKLWRESGDFDMVLIAEDGSFIITEGIEDSFALTVPAEMKVLKR